jgi:hypothetical protein
VGLEPGLARLTPWQVAAPVKISKIALSIAVAGAAKASIQMGVYTDNGNGNPGSLVAATRAVDATTVGVKEGLLTAPVQFHAGQYWLAALVVGGTGVEARGVPGSSLAMPATTASGAITGGTLTYANLTGLPSSVGVPGTGVTGAPRFAMFVP